MKPFNKRLHLRYGPCQQHDQASLQKEHFLSHFISTLFLKKNLVFILRINKVKVTTLSSMDSPPEPAVARPGREVESPTRVHTVKTSEAVSHHCLLRCLTLVR